MKVRRKRRYDLARHLKLADLPEREQAVRDRVIDLIRDTIKRAIPAPDAKNVEFNTPVGIELVEQWPIEDLPILEALVGAVNDPAVIREYLPWLFSTIQLLVANGPVEFAQY